jgi:hypothetical protein
LTVPGAGPSPKTLPSADLPACTACGACCFSTLPEYVRVFGCDFDRMDDRARAFTHFLGNRAYLRHDEGHCAALVVSAVSAVSGGGPSFVCSIYEMRPDVCRSLERGSGACRSDRHEKAERPLLAVESLLRRGALT